MNDYHPCKKYVHTRGADTDILALVGNGNSYTENSGVHY